MNWERGGFMTNAASGFGYKGELQRTVRGGEGVFRMSRASGSLGRALPGEPSSAWQALEESSGRKAGSHGLSTPLFHGDGRACLRKDSCVRWRDFWPRTVMFSEGSRSAGAGSIWRRKCSASLRPLLSVRSTGCPLVQRPARRSGPG